MVLIWHSIFLGSYEMLETSEYLSSSTRLWTPGPRLPMAVMLGCSVALNDDGTRHLLAGGVLENLSSTADAFIYDWESPNKGWEGAGFHRTP